MLGEVHQNINAILPDHFGQRFIVHADGIPPLMSALTTQWIHDGSATALLNGIRAEADMRRRTTPDIEHVCIFN